MRHRGRVLFLASLMLVSVLLPISTLTENTKLSFAGITDFSPQTSDSDGDGVLDNLDLCPQGLTNWISNSSTDHDNDGCKDETFELNYLGNATLGQDQN